MFLLFDHEYFHENRWIDHHTVTCTNFEMIVLDYRLAMMLLIDTVGVVVDSIVFVYKNGNVGDDYDVDRFDDVVLFVGLNECCWFNSCEY